MIFKYFEFLEYFDDAYKKYYSTIFIWCYYLVSKTEVTILKFIYFYFPGDEIFSINSVPVQGMTHQEAIGLFKEVKKGPIVVTIGRRASTGTLTKPVSTNHLASTTEIEE